MGFPEQQQRTTRRAVADVAGPRLRGEDLSGLGQAHGQGGGDHRRRQRDRPGRGHRVRPGGRGRPHLLSERGVTTPRRPPGGRGRGRKRAVVPGDYRDEAHCRAIIDRAVKEFGKVDILVSNAAYPDDPRRIWRRSPTEEFDLHLRRRTSTPCSSWSKAAVPHMRPRAGRSSAARRSTPICPTPTLAPYAATKAAIQNFTGGLAADARREGHPGEQRGARPDLDAADPRHDAARRR